MAKRTQIICMHEGKKGSADLIFANSFIKTYKPEWLRPFDTGKVHFVPCGGKSNLERSFPQELKNCSARGADTTLIVLADIDRLENGDELKEKYWDTAQKEGIKREVFETTVFIFPKYRIENWIQHLSTGNTDENVECPRVENSEAKSAGQTLADKCLRAQNETFPPSLEWSCSNWKALIKRMK